MTYEYQEGLGARGITAYGTLPEAQEYVAEEFMLPRPVPASSILPPVSPRKTRRSITVWRPQDALGESQQHNNMVKLVAWAAAGFAAAYLLSELSKRPRPKVMNPRGWLEQEMKDWGVTRWTPRVSERVLHPGIKTADEYVQTCRRLRREHIADARLLMVGFNHFSPKKWVIDAPELSYGGGYFSGFWGFWDSTQPRPEIVGSSYNWNPDTVFAIWKALGFPVTLSTRLQMAIKRAIDMFYAFEPFYAHQAEAALRSEREKRNLVLLILSPELFALHPGDRKKMLRLMRRSRNDTWKLRWIVSRLLKPYFEGHTTAWKFRPDYSREAQLIKIDWMTIQTALRMSREDFVKKFAPTGRGVWWGLHKYVPKLEFLKKLTPKAVEEFDKSLYLKIHNSPELAQDQTVWLERDFPEQRSRHATGLMFVFGHRWKQWLRTFKSRRAEGFSSVHDATYWLPTHPVAPGLDDFLFKHIRHGVHKLFDFQTIANRWNDLPPEERKGKFSDVLAAARIANYVNHKDRDFAKVAAEIGVPEEDYNEVENKYLNAIEYRRRVGIPDTIPDIVIERNGYKLFKMPYDSPKTLFIGAFSDCCMHPGGQAASCAWTVITNPYTSTFAFTDPSGNIVGSMWVWTPGGTDKGPVEEKGEGWIVIDSLEGPMVRDARRYRVFSMVDDFAKAITKDRNFTTVVIGYSRDVSYPPDWDDWLIKASEDRAVPPSGYSDAHYEQFIIRSPKKTAVKRQKALEEQSSLRTQEAFRQADRGEEFFEP
jgi:hypothetical protein